MYIRVFNLIALLLALSLPACAFDLAKTNLKDLKIISAEKLDYKDGDSVLIGNVKIKMGNYLISAPRVFVDSDKNGHPALVRFIENAELESKDLHINANKMFFDVKTSIFSCYANGSQLVETVITENKKEMKIYSWYQEYDLNAGTALVKGLEDKSNDYRENFRRVQFFRDELRIVSDSIEIQNKNSKTEYVDFLGDVIALDQEKRIQSQELLFFPDNSMLKAYNDVRILYFDEKNPTYLFADLVIYEDKEKILSAYSDRSESQSEVHSQNTFGHSRQIILNINKENKPETAILTGEAFAQHGDKALIGHEILFDVQKQNIRTLVGRPKTQILKVSNP